MCVFVPIRAKSPYAYGHHQTGMGTHTCTGFFSSPYPYSRVNIIADAYGRKNTIVDANIHEILIVDT